MTTAIQILGTISLVISVVVSVYFLVLLLVGLVSRFMSGTQTQLTNEVHRFAIVMPAHNEELLIADTLKACQDIDYPKDRLDIYVVADNCHDRTSELAKAAGVRCLERHDPDQPGKGFALAWAFPLVLAESCDAIVVLDADCRIDRHALRVFDARMQKGAKVLQAAYVASNPDESSISYALTVANTLENDLFYAPKSTLGLSVFLRGTGFVVHRSILERFPWQAGSEVEDAEYTATLLNQDIHIDFVPEIRVESPFPADQQQMRIQRTRWVGGGSWWARIYGLKYIWAGLRKCRPILVDAGWTSLVTTRAFTVGQLFLTLAVALLCYWLVPGGWSSALLLGSFTIVAIHLMYLCVGIALVGLKPHRIGFLCRLPLIAFQHLFISIVAICRADHSWNRTPRSGETMT